MTEPLSAGQWMMPGGPSRRRPLVGGCTASDTLPGSEPVARGVLPSPGWNGDSPGPRAGGVPYDPARL